MFAFEPIKTQGPGVGKGEHLYDPVKALSFTPSPVTIKASEGLAPLL